MKKTMLLVILAIVSVSAFCAEVQLYVDHAVYNVMYLSTEEFKVIYDTRERVLMINLMTDKIYISEKEIPHFRNILQKHLEWKSIAITNKVEVNRDIPNSEISIVVRSLFNNNAPVNQTLNFRIETYRAGKQFEIGGHYLVPGNVYFLRMQGLRTGSVYFYFVEGIFNAISEENLEKAIKEGNLLDEKQRQIDDLFK
jgi:hypothetical protein